MKKHSDILKLLHKDDNKQEIKSIFLAIVDICFLDLYPYLYFTCIVFFILILLNLGTIIYLLRGKFILYSKKKFS